MMYTKKLQQYLNAPKWLYDNVIFEGMTGSVSYGVSNDASDMDIVGICIPPKETIFPHLGGHIPGFGTHPPKFEVYQQHHIKDNAKEYDLSIYSIVKFFQLAMENNPNMVDVLFTPRRCVLHSTPIYEHLREHRTLFLHKGAWHKYKGYGYSQLSKARNKLSSNNPKRQSSIDMHGHDTKFLYHVIRLILEVEQILAEGNLDLERNSEILKSVRNGEWSLERIEEWFQHKEKSLETLYVESTLRYTPDEGKIKQLLMECLEMHYHDLSDAIRIQPEVSQLVADLQDLVSKYSR